MAGRRAFRSSADGRQGCPHALCEPLFRDGRIADVDQLATTRRDPCRLDKGAWPVLVTGCRTTDESGFNQREAVARGSPGLLQLARFEALFTRSSPDLRHVVVPAETEPNRLHPSAKRPELRASYRHQAPEGGLATT